MSTYLGFDVLDIAQFSRDGRAEVEYEDRLVRLDPGTGARTVDALAPAPAPVRSFVWQCFNRAEVAIARTFLEARRGRAVPFWLPSYQGDMTLTADIANGGSAATIARFGYALYMFNPSGARRHIAILTAGSAFAFRKITDAADAGGVTESLTFDPVASQLHPAATTIVMFLTLCRLEDDGFEFEWLNNQVARISLRFRELPQEMPL